METTYNSNQSANQRADISQSYSHALSQYRESMPHENSASRSSLKTKPMTYALFALGIFVLAAALVGVSRHAF